MSNVLVSRAPTDHMLTNMCGASAQTAPVSQFIGSPSSSGTSSPSFHLLPRAHETSLYSDTHDNEKMNDYSAVTYQVKVRPKRVQTVAIGAQRRRTRAPRKKRTMQSSYCCDFVSGQLLSADIHRVLVRHTKAV